MDREPIATGRLPALGGMPSQHLSRHRGRSPDPSKTHPRRGRGGRRRSRWHLSYLTECQGGSGGSGWSRGRAAAWGPAPSMADPAPRGYSAAAAVQRVRAAAAPDKWPGAPLPAPTRPTAACCRYRAGLHGLDLVEHLETERCSVELNREPAVRVIHHFHLLARLAPEMFGSSSSIIRSSCRVRLRVSVRSSRQARISPRSSAGVSGRCRSPVQARGRLLAFAGSRPKRVL